MATLTNTQISVTYVGLLKTSANTVLSSTAQQITDGSGNNSILFLSTAGVGIGGAAASGKELDVTGNVQITGDLIVDNIKIDGNTISAESGVVTLANGAIATTQSQNDNSTKIATTAYVDAAIDGVDTLAEILANGNTTGGGNIVFGDSATIGTDDTLIFGAGNDLRIAHNGTDSVIRNFTGGLYIDQEVDDGDIIFRSDNGAGSKVEYFKLDGSLVDGSSTLGATSFPDKSKIFMGAGNDLEIYHDGSNSFISDTGTGDLRLLGSVIRLKSAGDENMVVAVENAGVTLYYDAAAKLVTTSTGATVTGNIVSQTTSGNSGIKVITANDAEGFLIFGDPDDNSMGGMAYNNATNTLDIDCNNAVALSFDSSRNATFSENVDLNDSKFLRLGTGDDFQLFHDGSNSTIRNYTGNVIIENNTNDADIIFKSDDGSGGTTAYLTLDGSTEKNVFSKDAFFGDNVKALFGAGSDLQIYHDSNNSVINDNGTGDLYLMASSAIRLTNVGASEHYAKFIENGAVELYHDNSKKFETTSTGTTTQGVSQINGTDAKIRCLDTADFFYTDYGRDGINAFTNTNASAPIFFKTGGTERARIDASGNLGIGINSPDFLTHIYSTGNSVLGITAGTSAFATLQFGSTSDTTRGAIEYSTSDDSLRLKTGNNSEKMRITSGGLVGIGLTPTVPLDILAQNGTTDVSGITYNNIFRLRGTDSGGLLFLAKTSDQDQVIQTTNNDADLIFGTRTGSNNFNRLHIQGNTGNVGIGIEPTKKLTVFGTGAGNATVQIEGEGGADPYINFLANNTQHFSLGIDDSDSDKFKLSKHSALGTNDYLVVDTSGNATFAGAVDTGGNITATTSGNTFVSSVSTSTWAGMKIQASDSDSAYLFLFDTSGERARIQSTSNNDIKFSTNGGGSLALTLDSSTNATFAGNVTGGNGTFTNLTINATEKLRFDGAGGHTYIEEDSNDTLIFATGGTTRLTLDTNATFSGVALFSDGNGINFGNSDAKIYGSTANGIQFNGGGSEKMRLTQAGDLGINATSPNTKFEVRGAATTGSVGTASVARFGRPTSVGTSFDQYVDFKIGRHTAPGGAFQSYTRFDIDLRDDSTTTGNNTNIMTLLNDGRVGIGQVAPNSGVKLEVNGIISANGDNTPTGGGLGWGDYQTGGYKWIQSFESQELRINPLGNNVLFPASSVAIGITSPASGSQLTLNSSSSTGMTLISQNVSGECFINFADADDTNAGQIFYGHNPNRMIFRVNDATRVTIDDAGQAIFVGDVTLDSDSTKLKLGDSQDLQISHNGTDSQITNLTGALQFTQLQNDGNILFHNDDGSGGDTEYFRLDGGSEMNVFSKVVNFIGGAVGSPSFIFGGDDDTGLFHPAANTIAFSTFGNERMRIHAGGDVQIGSSGTSNLYFGNIISASSADRGMRIHTNNANTFFDFQGEANDELFFRDYDGSGGIHTRHEFGISNGAIIIAGGLTQNGSPSDIKYKENIKTISNGIDKIQKLNPVEFDWNDKSDAHKIGKKEDAGFIAQEVQKVLPNLVNENVDGDLALNYEGIIPYLVQSIQELKKEIEILKSK